MVSCHCNDIDLLVTAAANTGPPVTVNVLAPRSTQPYVRNKFVIAIANFGTAA